MKNEPIENSKNAKSVDAKQREEETLTVETSNIRAGAKGYHYPRPILA